MSGRSKIFFDKAYLTTSEFKKNNSARLYSKQWPHRKALPSTQFFCRKPDRRRPYQGSQKIRFALLFVLLRIFFFLSYFFSLLSFWQICTHSWNNQRWDELNEIHVITVQIGELQRSEKVGLVLSDLGSESYAIIPIKYQDTHI